MNEAVPGQNRLWEPVYFSPNQKACARRSRRASGLQVHVTRCESGAHVQFLQFHRIRESQLFSPALGAGSARGGTGVSDHFPWLHSSTTWSSRLLSGRLRVQVPLKPLFISISGYERASSTRLLWKQEQSGAAPWYPTSFITKSVRSSMAEHRSHNLKRVGSTPAGPTKLTDCLVAQSVRAFAFEAKGWRCESARGCHFSFSRPRSPTAETTASEAVQCRCKSCHGHHSNEEPHSNGVQPASNSNAGIDPPLRSSAWVVQRQRQLT